LLYSRPQYRLSRHSFLKQIDSAPCLVAILQCETPFLVDLATFQILGKAVSFKIALITETMILP